MNILVFVLAGLFCGFIDSCLGMGFGVTSASVLISFGVARARDAKLNVVLLHTY